MKELPYFKCFPDKWLAGDISTFGATEQGIFFNFCLFAWRNKGRLNIQENILCRRLQISEETLKNAISEFVKCSILLREESGEHYVIKFINEQLEEFGIISSIRSQAACKKQQMQANAVQMQANAEFCSAIKDKDKEEDKDNTITPNPLKGECVLFVKFQSAINSLYNRRQSTTWSDKEKKLLKEIIKRPDAEIELSEIEKLYNSGYEYFRRDIKTLLGNWTGEVDKARTWQPSAQPKKEVTVLTPQQRMEIERKKREVEAC